MADDGTVSAVFGFSVSGAPPSVAIRGQRIAHNEADAQHRIGDLQITSAGAMITLQSEEIWSPRYPTIRSEGTLILNRRTGVDLDLDGLEDLSSNEAYINIEELGHGNGGGQVMAIGDISASQISRHEAIFRMAPANHGTEFCNARRNSTGRAGRIIAAGSRVTADNQVDLRLFELPTGPLGFALLSKNAGPEVMPPGSQGVLCLSGSIGRYLPGVFMSDATGTARVTLGLTSVPHPSGTPVAVLAGETWCMQGWHRDVSPGTATSNFTTAIAVEFQ